VIAQHDPIRDWREFGRLMIKLEFEPVADAPSHVSFVPDPRRHAHRAVTCSPRLDNS
jgi:hypothetical protein